MTDTPTDMTYQDHSGGSYPNGNDGSGSWPSDSPYYYSTDNNANYGASAWPVHDSMAPQDRYRRSATNDVDENSGYFPGILRVQSPTYTEPDQGVGPAGTQHRETPNTAQRSKTHKKSTKRKKGSTDSTQSMAVHQGSDS
ncbi:hypothetical protein PG984_010772 [Apiospora sp. TS-2023a]